MSRIAVLGDAHQEILLIDHDDLMEVELAGESVFSGLKFGTTVDIDKAQFGVGGSGANAAVSFARHGHETIYLGSLAHDTAGEAVVRCFDAENIDTSYIKYSTGATGCTVGLLDIKTGESTTLRYQGVEHNTKLLDPNDLETIRPDWLYVPEMNGDMAKVLAFFEQANEQKIKIFWAPGVQELSKKQELLEMIAMVDVLVVNKEIAASLVYGVTLTEMLARLSNSCRTVVITDGIMGTIATDHQKTFRAGVYEQKHIKDFTGADDALKSGFLAAYADDEDLGSSLCFASANAAKVLQAYGAETGILTGDEKLHPMPIMQIENLSEWIIKEEND